ncbi:MAG: MMPL family transporter [Deltaproteobacteria bacterium]|nr:MMPL family transporter [Deltaproteobacteria bacterium]
MSFLDRLGRAILWRPRHVILGALLCLPVATWAASGIVLDQDFGKLLGEDHRAVRDLSDIMTLTGGTAFIVAAIDASNPSLAKAFADDAIGELEKLPEVLFVDGRFDIDFIEDRRLLYLPREQLDALVEETTDFIDSRLASASGLFVDLDETHEDIETFVAHLSAKTHPETALPKAYTLGDDGRYLYLFIRLRGNAGDLEFGRKALEAVKATFDARRVGAFASTSVRFAGSVLVRAEEDERMKADLQKASILGFVGVVLLMVTFTRRLRTLLLVSLPLLLGGALTFAFARVAIGHLNILTGFLAAILFGLGIDFTIHLFLRMQDELRRGASPTEAASISLTRTGPSVIAGALTTAGAMFVITFADFTGYNEFGVLAGVGILLMLLVALVVVPPLAVVLEPQARPSTPKSPAQFYLLGLCRSRLVSSTIVLATSALVVYSGIALYQGKVAFRTNWRDLKGTSPASDFDDYIGKSLGRSLTLTAVYLPSAAQLGELTRAVDRVRARRTADGRASGIRRLVSMRDLVPPDQAARLEPINRLRLQLERLSDLPLSTEDRHERDRLLVLTNVRPFTAGDLPANLRRRFEPVSQEGTLALLITDYLFYDVDQVIDWAAEMDELRNALEAASLDGARILSENWVAGTMFGVILNDGPFILWGTIAIVVLILIVAFRSLRHALVVFSVLAAGLVAIAGVMSIFDIDLNFMNAVIVPIIVGVGIDGAIHVYRRYLDEGPDSIPTILREVVPATFLGSATTAVGFGVMLTAHHRGIESVGTLALVGIGTTFLTTSVFFPLLLSLLHGSSKDGVLDHQHATGVRTQ